MWTCSDGLCMCLVSVRLHGFADNVEPSPVLAVTHLAHNAEIGIHGKNSQHCAFMQLEPLCGALIGIVHARQGAGYDLGGWEDHGEPQAAGEALINALRAQEDARAISRGAAGVNALCGPRCRLLPGLVSGYNLPVPSFCSLGTHCRITACEVMRPWPGNQPCCKIACKM